MEAPPLGINPRYLHDEQRYGALVGAINRHIAAGYQVPVEWITEYNELVERVVKRHLPPDELPMRFGDPDPDPVTKAYVEGR